MQHFYKFIIAGTLSAIVALAELQGKQTSEIFSAILLTVATFILSLLCIHAGRMKLHRVLDFSLGLIIALVASYLIQNSLSLILDPLASPGLQILLFLLPILFFTHLSLKVALAQFVLDIKKRDKNKEAGKNLQQANGKLLDTSTIIDGRIIEIAEAKFIDGPFIVPNYVLRELQLISDSSDPLKRSRGRRGLDMLNKLQEKEDIEIEISYTDYSNIREVDAKLVQMARECNYKLITNDFNLNKVATLQKVKVLNLNNLTNILKAIVLAGEELEIDILKQGKDEDQGIGYMDDGTMVVVENGGQYLSQRIVAIVNSVIQTEAGKMIFTTADRIASKQSNSDKANSGNGNKEGNKKSSGSTSNQRRGGGRFRQKRSGNNASNNTSSNANNEDNN